MATFAKSTFSYASYAAFRPVYPPSLYNTILAYHRGPKDLCLDLGCGHGVVSQGFSSSFAKVIGTDPSPGMVQQARLVNAQSSNVSYHQATAEDCSFLEDESVDMVVAGQASHWFDYPKLFPEMKRIVRRGGTLAFWGYSDPVFVNHAKATKILDHYSHGEDENLLGSYWQQPGRCIVENKLRDIVPPASDWEDIRRIEYEPRTTGGSSGKDNMFLHKRMSLGDCMQYIRTYSSFHAWQEKHPGRKPRDEGGEGDVVDEVFEEMKEVEPEWQVGEAWKDKEVDLEWGSGLLMARRK